MSTAAVLPADPSPVLHALLDKQRRAFRDDPMPTAEVRRERLARLEAAIMAHEDAVIQAIREDFGGRSRYESKVIDVMLVVRAAQHLRKHLGQWMRAERRGAGLLWAPSSMHVHVQPKGVVGVIAPWNYPVYLALIPAATALAAGNRVMVKPSELTPRVSAVMADILSCFDDGLAAVVQGSADVGAAFSALPFDHLVFTGSTSIGRKVMRAASEGLVPVTLELGGKSPAIVHPDHPIERAAGKIAFGKLLNAGQTCVAPDYVLLGRNQVRPFVESYKAEVSRRYPTLRDNDDYTAIVNDRHYARLQGWLADARAKGATVIEINPASEDLSGTRKMAPALVLDAPADATVMQDEIFGPILPVVPVDTVEDAIGWVNDRPRPLALYYFDDNADRAENVLDRTHSGGACVNTTVLHLGVDTLPFGGIGPSGMGALHGREGFDSLSHRKAVYNQSRIDLTPLLSAPFKSFLDRLVPVLRRLP